MRYKTKPVEIEAFGGDAMNKDDLVDWVAAQVDECLKNSPRHLDVVLEQLQKNIQYKMDTQGLHLNINIALDYSTRRVTVDITEKFTPFQIWKMLEEQLYAE